MSKNKTLYRIFVHAVFMACFVAGVAIAQTPADDPCDTDYYDSLKARAWLEAQREITQNQNLIFKPDSVLEYTCFDKYLDELAEHAIDMFSETTRWGTVLPSTSMDTALDNLVGQPNITYNDSNFDHQFLGGRLDGTNGLPDEDYKPDSISGGTYSCDRMNTVWMEAKCLNFIQNPNEDGFYTFEEYASQPDKRYKPSRNCSENRWNTNIQEATVDAQTPWTEDTVETYLNFLDPGACLSTQPGNNTPSSGNPVPTGLIVINDNFPNGFAEHVCVQPGCHYLPRASGNQVGWCVQSRTQ